MSESFWYIVEIIGFILAGAMLILNIILFIRLQIPILISELSGKQFEKEVKQIRASYVDYDKRNRIRRQGVERREASAVNPILKMNREAEMPKENYDTPTEYISYDNEETMMLSEQTEVLENQEITSVLQVDNQYELVRNIILIHTDERI